jgi:hypothetical protein
MRKQKKKSLVGAINEASAYCEKFINLNEHLQEKKIALCTDRKLQFLVAQIHCSTIRIFRSRSSLELIYYIGWFQLPIYPA